MPPPRWQQAGARTVIGPLGRVLRPDRIALHADFLRRHARLSDGAGAPHVGRAQPPAPCVAMVAPSWSASATATTHCS